MFIFSIEMKDKKDFENSNERLKYLKILKDRKSDLTSRLKQIERIENLVGERVFSATLEMDKIDQLLEISGISFENDEEHYVKKKKVLEILQDYESYSSFKLNHLKKELKELSYELTKKINFYS